MLHYPVVPSQSLQRNVSEECRQYVQAVDNALPSALLQHLQHGFARSSDFWEEHDYGRIGYFSYMHSLVRLLSSYICVMRRYYNVQQAPFNLVDCLWPFFIDAVFRFRTHRVDSVVLRCLIPLTKICQVGSESRTDAKPERHCIALIQSGSVGAGRCILKQHTPTRRTFARHRCSTLPGSC